MPEFTTVLGVRFYGGDLTGLLDLTSKGGLIVVPSAPVLGRLSVDRAHREALLDADFAVTDSGLMVLLWFALKRRWLTRSSGLKYLSALIDTGQLSAPGDTFWIMPTPSQAEKNLEWLASRGIHVEPKNVFIAPKYGEGPLKDDTLVAQLTASSARYVIICLGGGVQERLGHYLKHALPTKPALICTGAAIAFLSGQQVKIPVWADRLFLGWLFRTLSSPKTFLPRYGAALNLIPLMIRYRAKAPALRAP